MIDRICNFIREYNLSDKTIIVGFSGGFDSMCLLDILSKIKNDPEFDDMRVIAAHFNHNWRGEESLREQEVCKLFAASRGFEFFTKNAPSTLKKTEKDARIARYDFFEEAFENFDANAVFTAHNKDDNAETVLYRIIKGTGLIGLKGISQKRDIYYRPLLKTSRREILDYCNTYNLAPNNDSSNSDTTYARNYIRLNVIPSMEKVNPTVKEALNTLSVNAINDNEIIEEYLSTIRPKLYDERGILLTQEYMKLSYPVKLRILYEFIQKLDLDYDSKKISEIYDFIDLNSSQRNGSTLSLASALWLYADEKIVETIPRRSEIQVSIDKVEVSKEGEYQVGERVFSMEKYEDKNIFVFPQATADFAYVDLSNVEFPLILRTRKDGDVITPFGMSGSMKLKKFLNSKGVSRHKRDNIILLCDANEVLWVSGVGLSNKIGVKTKPTHVIKLQ